MADATIKVSADTSEAERALGRLNNTIKGLASVAIGGSLFKFVDDLQNMQNKLRVATKNNDEFNQSLAIVKAIADSTGQSMGAIGDVYAKVSANSEKLGYTTEQVGTVTNSLAMALKASGTSAEGARSTMYQFGQILNKGKVNGDEFTTMVENLSGPVMGLLAKNMGMTTAEFMKYKEKGLVGAKDFTDALIRSTKELADLQGKTLPTLGQSLQRIENSFGDFIIKVDRSTGITNALANAMSWLSKNVDIIVPLVAALMGYLVAGRLLSFAVAAYEVAKGIQAIGISAAVMEALATGGVSALVGLTGAAVAFAGAKALFDQVDSSVGQLAIDLNKMGDNANTGLGNTKNQLTGVSELLKTMLKDLDEEAKITAANSREYKFQSDILAANKQSQYLLTASQKQELMQRYLLLEALKAARSYTDDMRAWADETRGYMAMTTVEAKAQSLYLKYVNDYGQTNADLYKKSFQTQAEIYVKAQEQLKITKDMLVPQNQLAMYARDIGKYSIEDLDTRLQLIKIQTESGIQLNSQAIDQLRITENTKRQLEYLRQIKSSTQSAFGVQTGAQAGATAAGQLGSLSPMDSALSANTSLFNGIQYLRNNDLINEQTYQNARVSAAVQAMDAIMAAQNKMFENENLLRIQQQTGSQFGFSTQKQMAKDAADFQQKSDTEKYAFALDQASQMYTQLGTYNKQAFESAKAFNIANAIMNTYMAATKALATYPWPFNLVAVGASIAMGMAQVAAIRSQTYSGRALGGPVQSGTPYIVGERGPELFTPSTSGNITRNDNLGGKDVNINFTIQANDAQGFDDLLVQRRGMITQFVRDAMAEQGQRSRM